MSLWFGLILFSGSLADAQEKVTYEDHVKPILRQHCFSCHTAEKRKGDLELNSFTSLMAGSSTGQIVSAGEPGRSRLWRAVSHQEEPFMPPKKPRISEAELKVIKAWIEGGLLETSGSKPIARSKPKVQLALKAPSIGKPDGPPPMPGDVLLEPVVATERPNAVTAMAHSPWAPLLAIGGQKQVILYNTDTFELAGILPFEEGFPKVVRFSRNGKLLLAAGGRGARLGLAVLWDVKTGRRIIQVGDELDSVMAADISADQTMIAIGGPNKLVKAFSTADGSPTYTIKKHTDWITVVAYSPDAVLLATGDRNGGLQVWEARSGKQFYDLRGHRGGINAVAWRSDSNVLASASEDGTIKQWNMNDGSQIRSIAAHGGGVRDVRFAHDGRMVSAGRDRVVKIWNSNGGQVRVFEAFGEPALSATFTHDGKRVVGGDWSGRVRVWNAADGRRLAELAANPPLIANRIEALTARLSKHKITPDEAVARRSDAEIAASAASHGLMAARLRKTALEAKVKAFIEHLGMLKTVIDKSKATIADAEGKLPALRAEAARLQKAVPDIELALLKAMLEHRTVSGNLKSKRMVRAILDQAAKLAGDAAAEDAELKEAAEYAQKAAEKSGAAVAKAEKASGATAAALKTATDRATATKTALKKATGGIAALEGQAKKARADQTAAVTSRILAADALKQDRAELGPLAASLPGLDASARDASDLSAICSGLARWRAADVFTGLHRARAGFEAVQAKREGLVLQRGAAQASLDQARKVVAALDVEIKDAPATLAAQETAVGEAKSGLVNATGARDAAKALLSEKQSATQSMSERMGQADAAEKAFVGVLEKVRAELAGMKEATTKARSAVDSVVEALKEVEEAVKAQEEELAKAKALLKKDPDNEDLAKGLVQHKAKLKSLNSELGAKLEIRKQVVEAESAAQKKESSVVAAVAKRESEHAPLVKAAAESRAAHETAVREQKTAEQGVAAMDKAVQDAAAAVNGADKAFADLRAKIQADPGRLEELQEAAEMADDRVIRKDMAIEKIDKRIAEAQALVDKIAGEYDQARPN